MRESNKEWKKGGVLGIGGEFKCIWEWKPVDLISAVPDTSEGES